MNHVFVLSLIVQRLFVTGCYIIGMKSELNKNSCFSVLFILQTSTLLASIDWNITLAIKSIITLGLNVKFLFYIFTNNVAAKVLPEHMLLQND